MILIRSTSQTVTFLMQLNIYVLIDVAKLHAMFCVIFMWTFSVVIRELFVMTT